MESFSKFANGVEKIHYDLDGIEDLKSKLHLVPEASLKDIGKAVKPHVLPWAAAAALGTGLYNNMKPMSNEEKFDNASAIYQYAVVSKNVDLNDSAKEFVNLALTLPMKERKALRAQLDKFKANLSPDRQERMEEFQSNINYQVNQFNINRWANKEESMNENARNDAKFDQEVFDILSDQEADIETGEYTQDEIVDKVAEDLANRSGTDISTEQGARIETNVENYFRMLGLDSIPPDTRSRDYLAGRSTQTAPVVDENQPPKQPLIQKRPAGAPPANEPYVQSDDELIGFLRWLTKQVDDNNQPTFDAKRIVDVVEEPHHYSKEYQQYLNKIYKQESDPYL